MGGMDGDAVLDALRGRGLRVEVDGAALRVGPSHLLTDVDRATIAAHKADIIAALAHTCSSTTIVAHPPHPIAPMSNYGASPSPASLGVSEGDALDAATLCRHLAILYPTIREGCLLGLHRALRRVPAEVVRAVIAGAGPDTDPDAYAALCQRAGRAAMLAATIDEYGDRVRRLDALGEDTFAYAAALGVCLVHPECADTRIGAT